MQIHFSRCGIIALAAATFSFTTDARAQYSSGFESLAISPGLAVPYAPDTWDPSQPAGTPGQDNFYWPSGTMSVPHQVQVYTGGAMLPGFNDYGIADNPNGGGQFIVGNGPASPTFARAQRDISYPTTGTVTWATDICCLFDPGGNLPTAQNLGSFSVQPFAGAGFIMLARWTDVNTAATWDADYVWFDANDTQILGSVNDPGFQNLMTNHWYRWETVADLGTNQILEVRLTDLTTCVTVTNNPVGRYMDGGIAGGVPPTGFRFFAGGGVAGNIIAWDNPSIGPSASSAASGAGCVGTNLTSNTSGPQIGSFWGLTFGPTGAIFTTDFVTVALKLGPSAPGAPIPAPSYGSCMNYLGAGPFVILPLQFGVNEANYKVYIPADTSFFGINMAAQGIGYDTIADLLFSSDVQDATTGS